MKKSLENAIEAFLADKRKSRGGWAEVTQTDMDLLVKVCNELRQGKCQRDPDGDIPIEFDLVNRCTHESNNYLSTRYTHKLATEELKKELSVRMCNLKIAMRAVEELYGYLG